MNFFEKLPYLIKIKLFENITLADYIQLMEVCIWDVHPEFKNLLNLPRNTFFLNQKVIDLKNLENNGYMICQADKCDKEYIDQIIDKYVPKLLKNDVYIGGSFFNKFAINDYPNLQDFFLHNKKIDVFIYKPHDCPETLFFKLFDENFKCKNIKTFNQIKHYDVLFSFEIDMVRFSFLKRPVENFIREMRPWDKTFYKDNVLYRHYEYMYQFKNKDKYFWWGLKGILFGFIELTDEIIVDLKMCENYLANFQGDDKFGKDSLNYLRDVFLEVYENDYY